MTVRDRPAFFERYRREINLTIIFLFVFNDLIEIFVAIINIFLRLYKPSYHLPPYIYQDVLTSMSFE
jgi:hypothetical protein